MNMHNDTRSKSWQHLPGRANTHPLPYGQRVEVSINRISLAWRRSKEPEIDIFYFLPDELYAGHSAGNKRHVATGQWLSVEDG